MGMRSRAKKTGGKCTEVSKLMRIWEKEDVSKPECAEVGKYVGTYKAKEA